MVIVGNFWYWFYYIIFLEFFCLGGDWFENKSEGVGVVIV